MKNEWQSLDMENAIPLSIMPGKICGRGSGIQGSTLLIDISAGEYGYASDGWCSKISWLIWDLSHPGNIASIGSTMTAITLRKTVDGQLKNSKETTLQMSLGEKQLERCGGCTE
jgi:hypothetical protein